MHLYAIWSIDGAVVLARVRAKATEAEASPCS